MAREQEMPDQPQGLGSKGFQLDKAIKGSSVIALLKEIKAPTDPKKKLISVNEDHTLKLSTSPL